MCDVSDGLLADLGHIAAASGVVVDLDRGLLEAATLALPGPLPQVAAALGADPMAWVLTGGEDHALVATFPAGAALPARWAAIGAVREGGPAVLVGGRPAETVADEVGAQGTGHVHF
jgi:thiamine-monophosphate kinase